MLGDALYPCFFFQGFGKFNDFNFPVLLLGTFYAFTFNSESMGCLSPCVLPFWRGSCNTKNKENCAFKEKMHLHYIKDELLKLNI